MNKDPDGCTVIWIVGGAAIVIILAITLIGQVLVRTI